MTEKKGPLMLSGALSLTELRALRDAERFTCPHCHSPVLLRAGDVKTPHFAHAPRAGCTAASEPESSQHLQGKLQLYHFFQSQNVAVQLEAALPEIRQRADLLTADRTAVEFQCSPISAAELRLRTENYQKAGYQPVWIAGNAPSEEGVQELRLKAFEQEILSHSAGGQTLLYFSPSKAVFIYACSLFHISGNTWAGAVRKLTAANQRFPFGIPKSCTQEEYAKILQLFLLAKERYIRGKRNRPRYVNDPFWRSCYRLGLDPLDLPAYIGIPVAGSHVFRKPAVLWQLEVLEQNLRSNEQKAIRGEGPAEKAAAKYLETAQLLKEVNSPAGRFELLYYSYCKTY